MSIYTITVRVDNPEVDRTVLSGLLSPVGEVLSVALQVPDDENYSVWVGGVEVNDVYLTRTQAADLAKDYLADGYDDVFITESKEIY